MAVRAWWASSMPAKASLGGGAPRAACGVGPGGRSAARGEVSPFVMSHRAVGEGPAGADRGRGLGLGLAAVLVRIGLDLADVVLRLRVGRHAAVALYRARAGVVRGERLRHVATECVELLAEVLGAGVDVLGRVVHVGAAERGGGAGHQLAQALRPGRASGGGVEVGLLADQPAQQGRVDAVLGGGGVDLGLVGAVAAGRTGGRSGGGGAAGRAEAEAGARRARLDELLLEVGAARGGGLDAGRAGDQRLDLTHARDGGCGAHDASLRCELIAISSSSAPSMRSDSRRWSFARRSFSFSSTWRSRAACRSAVRRASTSVSRRPTSSSAAPRAGRRAPVVGGGGA